MKVASAKRRKTGHIPSRHNSHQEGRKTMIKKKPKGIINDKTTIWITTGIFIFAVEKKKKEQRSSMRDTLQKQFGLELD